MAKILIAEDDSVAQREVTIIVERLGHTCFISPNGRNAYEVLTAYNKFDLLITDYMMPHMDGKELIKLIRENTALRHLPIIVMSGVISINMISEIIEWGASFFIGKPLKTQQLREYIEKCLKVE